MPEQNETRREIAEKFVEKWPIFASPVDAVELLLKCRDERAVRLIREHRERDICRENCWTAISNAIVNEES